MESFEKQYTRVRERAEKKIQDNLTLSSSEKLALSGQWFISFPIPVNVVRDMVKQADEAGCKPYEIMQAIVFKGLGK